MTYTAFVYIIVSHRDDLPVIYFATLRDAEKYIHDNYLIGAYAKLIAITKGN